MSMIAYYVSVDDAELEGLLAGSVDAEEFLSRCLESDSRGADIDKAWAGIHYLLCGSVWEGTGPLFNAVLGGTPLGEEDFGYGPARYLRKDEAAQVFAALSGIDFSAFRPKFLSDVQGNTEIYPGYSEEDDFNYLEYNFAHLVGFFKSAAASSSNVVLFLS
jgi:hypothetical protein